ncbi:DExH-box ATP-dependent RNA helicase DExH16, mitochondrial [Vitis vinifera]|uniref:DExH-box ATP-dependent RNA helicase DExH16, mitochondrial n=1 Tax=Vitis vinifera TaxID=29760 RepID=A0A438KMD7_VITVI|nr:DExH-box ATP-dependent RNA helicase DExH16, mitochondrial [Vitis vinifera]
MLLLSLSLSLFYLYFYFLPFFQMLGCRTRGFSFTRALLGISADELHLCGDVSSVPLIQGILKVTGDDFEVMKSSVDMHLVKLPLVLIFEGTFFLQYFPSDEILLEHGLVGILMLTRGEIGVDDLGFQVQYYERLSPLVPLNVPLRSFSDIQTGDCIVTFSRRQIYKLKRQIENGGKHLCSVVYGSLPPETRTRQVSVPSY